ncbi:unnamed protein product [Microthlaspi erraticum]|uniref:Uncharacterized protein n=1 Tax=Microthlaspi erraticum TaxID=1685480 RepID=A0A6D2IXQ7_9BRAS|nr:unnamed protein product [Microthlaspi erraticum]
MAASAAPLFLLHYNSATPFPSTIITQSREISLFPITASDLFLHYRRFSVSRPFDGFSEFSTPRRHGRLSELGNGIVEGMFSQGVPDF